MRNVDLSVLRFDFDQTFAAIVMHADGRIYHRYGSRGPDDPTGYQSLSSLSQLLVATKREHVLYDRSPKRPVVKAPQRVINMPILKAKLAAGQRIDCVHCHVVNDVEHHQAVKTGTWDEDNVYVFPDPERVGFSLDQARQSLLSAIVADSPAARAGLLPGDELLSLGSGPSVRTLSDVQWVLHHLPRQAVTVAVRYRRQAKEHEAVIELGTDWKRCTPEDYAWRASKWNLSPAPGFGGPMLDAAAKRKLGLAPGLFALKVGYIVDWGRRAHRGRAVHKAGLLRGDIVLSFGGKSDFESFEHLHAWTGLTLKAGQDTEITVLRKGNRVTLRYPLPN